MTQKAYATGDTVRIAGCPYPHTVLRARLRCPDAPRYRTRCEGDPACAQQDLTSYRQLEPIATVPLSTSAQPAAIVAPAA